MTGTPVGTPRLSPVHRRGRARRWLIAGALLATVLFGYYLITFWQVRSAGRTNQARPVDAIVVMGAAQYDGRPSPQLAARLDHVVTLWPEGLAPLVVVTGGKRLGDRFTEAEASAAYLIERGVPADAIVLEDAGTTTYESLAGVADLLGSDDRVKPSVLIVTDPFHTLRSKLVASEVGLVAYGSPTPTSVVSSSTSLWSELREAAGVSIGRLIGFGRLDGLTG